MKVFGHLAIPFTLAALAAPAAALAQSGPNPNEPYIASITYGGSGCPQGTVGSSFANDRKSYTLIFDAFVASAGPSIPVTEARKTCQVSLNIHIPQGTSATCMSTTHRGYYQKPNLARVTQQAIYSLDGPETSQIRLTPLEDPLNEDYLTRDYAPLAFFSERATVSTTTMTTNLKIETSGDPTQITTDSIDGKLGTCDFIASNGDPFPAPDLTAPIITPTRSVEPNVNGWNNTDVTFSYACTGIGAVIESNSMLEPGTLTESGRAHAACTVENSGAIALSYYFADIDKVPPTVAATSPVSGGLFGLNSVVAAAGSCSDDNSGIASCTAASTLDTSSLGAKLFTATAVDRAGNSATASIPYSVGGKDDCKSNGYSLFLTPTFKNQGQCVSTYAGKK